MHLTVYQMDALQELINIGIGRAANVLNEMISSPICLHVPYIEILSLPELQPRLEKRFRQECLSAVGLGFSGSMSGNVQLVFPTDSASKLVSILTGEQPGTADLDAVKIGCLSEVGNIVINGVMGAISNILKQRLKYSLPTYLENNVDNLLTSPNFANGCTNVLAQAHFLIEQLQIEGNIILIFKVGSFDALLKAINEIIAE